MNEDVLSAVNTLRAAGAPGFDAVGWHYIETLAARTQAQTGTAQQLLTHKLQQCLDTLQARMHAAAKRYTTAQAGPEPSPLVGLLQHLQAKAPGNSPDEGSAWRAESPRIQQFRKQLSQISVQKQVSQAIALAPQNAGPINSHMLVLRSLGLMRSISPDYLNRFMAHVDTLLYLEEADKGRATAAKAAPAAKKSRSKSV